MYDYSNMNYNNGYYPVDTMNQSNIAYTYDERGFLVPFVLGGITGGLLAPAFYRPQYYGPGPCYGPNCYGYRPYYY